MKPVDILSASAIRSSVLVGATKKTVASPAGRASPTSSPATAKASGLELEYLKEPVSVRIAV